MTRDKLIIAIDGPSAAGKTSAARTLAKRLGYIYLDSGALYRAITLAALDLPPAADPSLVLAAARQARVRLVPVGTSFRPDAGGVDVSRAIRTAEVTARVSGIAALGPVRDWVNGELRNAAAVHPVGVVVDGRDIGTVVFPDAPLKVFLTAAPEERARRRLAQDGQALNGESLGRAARDLHSRDVADSSRAVAPLRPAADAVVLDTTVLSFAQQVEEIVKQARKLFAQVDIAKAQD